MRKMKNIKITYKDSKRLVDYFTCDSWSIDKPHSLFKLYEKQETGLMNCTTLIRLPEILKIEIT